LVNFLLKKREKGKINIKIPENQRSYSKIPGVKKSEIMTEIRF